VGDRGAGRAFSFVCRSKEGVAVFPLFNTRPHLAHVISVEHYPQFYAVHPIFFEVLDQFFVPGICFSCSYSKLNIELHTLVEQGLETLNLFSIMSWSRMIGRYQPNTYTAFQTDWAVFFRVFGHTIFLRMEFFRVG